MQIRHYRFRITLVGLIGLVLLSGCSKQAKLERGLKRANAHFEARDYGKAEVEYLNVLRFQPTNGLVVKRLATIYFDQGKVQQALRFWLGAGALNSQDIEPRIRVGQILLSTRDFRGARDQALYVLERDPKNDDAFVLLSDAARAPKDVADAQKRLQLLQDQAGNRASYHLALATLHMRQTNSQAAEVALQKALSLEPASARVQLAMGYFSRYQNDLKKADQHFQKAAELAPSRSTIRLQQVEFKLRAGATNEARTLLQQITREAPDDVRAWIQLAQVEFDSGNYAECMEILNRVMAQDVRNIEGGLLRARVKRIQGKAGESVSELEDLYREYPRSPGIALELARSHAQNREREKAMVAARQAATLAPGSPPILILLAELSMEEGNFAEVITLMRDLLTRTPDLGRAHFLLATAYSAQGRHAEALAVYEGLERRFPNNEVLLLKGVTLRQLNRNAEARKSLQRAFELTPDDLLVARELVDLDLLDRAYPAALQRVQNCIAKNPRAPAARVLEARVHLAQNNLPGAEAAIEKAIELEPKFSAAYEMMARIYFSTKRVPQALEKLQAVLARDPKDASALLLLATIYNQTGETNKATAKYQELLQIEPQSVSALNNLACLLSAKPDTLDDAFAHATKARQLAPQDATVADTLGWVLYLRRDYARALPLFLESLAKSPNHAEIQYHVGLAQYMMGQEESARVAFKRALELSPGFPGRDQAQSRLAILDASPTAGDPAALAKLENLLKQQPDDLLVLLRLGSAYESAGAPDKARQTYEDARKLNPNSVPVLVRLAQIYAGIANGSTQALAMARDARKLAPNDPQIAHTLGRLAYQEGDQSWALGLLQESAQKLPNNSEVLFDLAHAIYSVGRVTDSEEIMRRARQAGSAWAKDQDAQWFLALTDYFKSPEKRLAAEAQVQQLLKSKPDYLPALMVAGLIRQQRGQHVEARQSYEKILERSPLFAPARKQLAAIYTDQLDDQQKAQDYATKARASLPDDPEVAFTLGKIAYRRADYRNAVRYLQESGRKLPDDAGQLFLLGMAYYGLKDKKESLPAEQALTRALALSPNASFAAEAKKTLAELKSGPKPGQK